MRIPDLTKTPALTSNVIEVFGINSSQLMKRRVLKFAIAAGVMACLWTGYVWYGKPKLDEHRLGLIFNALSASSEPFSGPARVTALTALPREQMLLMVFEDLSTPFKDIEDQLRLDGARSALDLAIAEGSDEARLMLGKAFRDGIFGSKNSVDALREFQKVQRNIDAGVQAGDSDALYIHALMLSEGLGVRLDGSSASEAMSRSAEGLGGWRLKKLAGSALSGLGAFNNEKKPELAARLALRMMSAGDNSAYWIGARSCN
ncbi:MAG: hypothetical protein LH479_02605 [Polaromonas sp.]|nr:hypothetical protein [Polaromonas sp.]